MDDVDARAKALKLPHPDKIAADALPGARLVPGGEATLGGTRLGGNPDLPRGWTGRAAAATS